MDALSELQRQRRHYAHIRARLMGTGAFLPRRVLEALQAREEEIAVLDAAVEARSAVLDERERAVARWREDLAARTDALGKREARLAKSEASLAAAWAKLETAQDHFRAEKEGALPSSRLCSEEKTLMPPRQLVPMRDILRAVADRWGVSADTLISLSRSRRLTPPRRAFVALAREFTLRSLPEIGAMMGGRDHSTILHYEQAMQPAVAAIRARLDARATFSAWLEAIYAETKEMR